MAAKLNDPSAENSFGVCLERGIGVQLNLPLAARHYQRSAAHGDPHGANNLGFCLEHGRGVKQDIEAAARCYKFASDHGHPEGQINYRRCLRILGQWDGSDRSTCTSNSASADMSWSAPFIACLDDCDASVELVASLERLKAEMAGPRERRSCNWNFQERF
jgi:TPR repeat protein